MTLGEQPRVFSFWCRRSPSYSSGGFSYWAFTEG